MHPSLTGAHIHDNTRTNILISKMSVPEIPSNIADPEVMFQASPMRVDLLTEKVRSELTKSQERL